MCWGAVKKLLTHSLTQSNGQRIWLAAALTGVERHYMSLAQYVSSRLAQGNLRLWNFRRSLRQETSKNICQTVFLWWNTDNCQSSCFSCINKNSLMGSWWQHEWNCEDFCHVTIDCMIDSSQNCQLSVNCSRLIVVLVIQYKLLVLYEQLISDHIQLIRWQHACLCYGSCLWVLQFSFYRCVSNEHWLVCVGPGLCCAVMTLRSGCVNEPRWLLLLLVMMQSGLTSAVTRHSLGTYHITHWHWACIVAV